MFPVKKVEKNSPIRYTGFAADAVFGTFQIGMLTR